MTPLNELQTYNLRIQLTELYVIRLGFFRCTLFSIQKLRIRFTIAKGQIPQKESLDIAAMNCFI